MYNTNTQKTTPIPGRKGAIARLIGVGFFLLIGLFSIIFSVIDSNASLGTAILDILAGIGMFCLVATWYWVVMKWVGFIAPKSFRLAKRFWCAWHVLTFFGLYIKSMIWMILAIAPVSAIILTFSPLFKIIFLLAQDGVSIFGAFATLALGAALVLLVIFLDVCKLRRRAPLTEMKQLLISRKAA